MSDKVRRYFARALLNEQVDSVYRPLPQVVMASHYDSLESKLKALIEATRDLMFEVGDMPGEPEDCIASWAKVEKAIAEAEEEL